MRSVFESLTGCCTMCLNCWSWWEPWCGFQVLQLFQLHFASPRSAGKCWQIEISILPWTFPQKSWYCNVQQGNLYPFRSISGVWLMFGGFASAGCGHACRVFLSDSLGPGAGIWDWAKLKIYGHDNLICVSLNKGHAKTCMKSPVTWIMFIMFDASLII